MIWNNPGHQLDEIGKVYLKVKNIRLFAFGTESKKEYEFLKFLGLTNELSVSFIYDKTEHESDEIKEYFCGEAVTVYDENSSLEDIVDTVENTIVVLGNRNQTRRVARLKKMGVKYIFYMDQCRLGKDNFIQNFVCIYMMYKKGVLVSHWTNYLVTMRCDLNCRGCLNFNNYLNNPCDVSLDAFKKHFVTVFNKFDYLYSLHFTGGEVLLTKDLKEKILFLEEYKNRIYDFFIITNGTVIPQDDVLDAIKRMDGWVLIDDYSDTVEFSKIPLIEEKLKKAGIKYIVSKAPYWFDLSVGSVNYENLTSKELENHKDSCQAYLHEFAEGNIYACCYQQYAHRAGRGPLENGDYISINDRSKMEILEFRQGFTEQGYTSLCKYCRGLGDNAKKILVAEQIK